MKNSLLVTDANVMIDFYQADPELIEALCLEFQVKISKTVMDEIIEFTSAQAGAFGIEIIETEDSVGLLPLKLKGLSFQDKSCILLTKKLKASCLTNDSTLKNYLDSEGLKTYWGLEMLLLLIEKGRLTKEKVREAAEKIFQINLRFSEPVKKQFWKNWDNVHSEK